MAKKEEKKETIEAKDLKKTRGGALRPRSSTRQAAQRR